MTIYTLTAVNLFCGDHDPENGKHLTLAELKLPDLQAIYADHMAGGAPMGIEVEVGFNKLEPTFKLNGFDPELLSQFGAGGSAGYRRRYTAYGNLRDERSGRDIPVRSIIEGRLGRVAPDAFQKGELQGHEYAINSVVHYEVWFDDREKLYWDFFTRDWRVDGEEQFLAERRNLGIS